jgi:hypothetical protein
MKTEQDMLLTQLDRYWECFECGCVIDDPSLAKALETAGMGWGLGVPCPKCGCTVSKSKFPNERFRPLFKMMVECCQIERAILVLILAQTAFEGMLDDFLWRLLNRMNCPEDISLVITDKVRGINAKASFIKSLTGKDIKKMIRDMGFKNTWKQFETIRKKRNVFLHTAKGKEGLSRNDIKAALEFAYVTVDLYAALFSEHRDWRPLVEPEDNFH